MGRGCEQFGVGAFLFSNGLQALIPNAEMVDK
jgi:hypothetical protein